MTDNTYLAPAKHGSHITAAGANTTSSVEAMRGRAMRACAGIVSVCVCVCVCVTSFHNFSAVTDLNI